MKMPLCISCLLFLAVGQLAMPSAPQAELSTSEIQAKFYLPDVQSGYYRGTRFDWAGQIHSLRWKNHEYFGQWFDKYDPKLHDAIAGPVEEFLTNMGSLGYSEAKVGEPFVRIGVGTVRKSDDKDYQRFNTYDIVDPGTRKQSSGKDWIEFVHELKDSGVGYSYVYRKKLQIVDGTRSSSSTICGTRGASGSRRASTTTTSSRSTTRQPARMSSSGFRTS